MRAIQDLRKEAELELDDRIELWLEGVGPDVQVHLPPVFADTLADTVTVGAPPAGVPAVAVKLESGEARIALRKVGA
ncbi:MAG: hypothetical protein U0838_08730 [Chloroflexota bacterium]